MPTYEYMCDTCGQHYDAFRSIKERNDAPACPKDGGATKRIIGKVNFARSSVQTDLHLSSVTGQLVRNAKDVEEQIKRMNEEQGTHYVMADPTDPSMAGVTDEGLDATYRNKTETGEREGTLWL